jgi:hypothetical protein
MILLIIGYDVSAQITAIPDSNFEQVLIDLGIDTDGVINSQMTTSDALGITTLLITSPDDGTSVQYIQDLSGIEAFVNLESLQVNVTMIEELDLSALVNLKYLDCTDNMLSSLDVSHNPVLEELIVFMGGDVLPMNSISQIDLSNNPLIHTLTAYGIDYINLQNGNNNPNMNIDISAGLFGMDPEYIHGHTCIEVDDEAAAQADMLPYSQWIITHENQSYALVGSCELGNESFTSDNSISIYPNPTSDNLYFSTTNGNPVEKAVLYDISGRVVKEFSTVSNSQISVAGLAKGVYMVQMFSGNTTQTAKVVVE